MKLTFFLLACLVVLPTRAQDLDQYQRKEYSSKGQTLRYRILYPKDYDRSKKYPLVLFLHGAGERGNDNEKQLTHGAKLFLKDEVRTNFPSIVIFPQCPTDEFWSSVKIDRTATPPFVFNYANDETPSLHLVMELVKRVIKEESVDKHRVYITGLSMGGMGTFEAVYRYPKIFATALPICGGGDDVHYDKRIKKTKFWIFHGDQDPVVDVKNSRVMVDRLKSLKATVQYSEYPGVKHNSWDNAFAEPDFLKWMFDQRR